MILQHMDGRRALSKLLVAISPQRKKGEIRDDRAKRNIISNDQRDTIARIAGILAQQPRSGGSGRALPGINNDIQYQHMILRRQHK